MDEAREREEARKNRLTPMDGWLMTRTRELVPTDQQPELLEALKTGEAVCRHKQSDYVREASDFLEERLRASAIRTRFLTS